MPKPRFRLYGRRRHYAAIAAELATGRWRRGEAPAELERRVAAVTGSPHALCVAKARVGIFLLVRALLGRRRRVVLSPYTISDVVNMVVCAGGEPVFADVEPGSCNLDPAAVAAAIDDGTGVVLVTHLHGLAADLEPLQTLCRERGIALVEDAAQAFGTRWRGRHVGTVGTAGVYSFGMYKNINAFFGGMIVTADAELDARIRAEVARMPLQEPGYYLRKVGSGAATDLATWPPLFSALTYPVARFAAQHDLDAMQRHTRFDLDPALKRTLPESYLRRLSPLQARLALAQLDRVDALSGRRVAHARRYHAGLRGLERVGLPPLRDDLSHTYSYFPVRVADRAGVLRSMLAQGRDLAPQHLRNCADLGCFAGFASVAAPQLGGEPAASGCPVARSLADSVLLLPTWPGYGEDEVERTIRALHRALGSS